MNLEELPARELLEIVERCNYCSKNYADVEDEIRLAPLLSSNLENVFDKYKEFREDIDYLYSELN